MKKKSLTEHTEWLPGIQLSCIQYYLCSTCGGSLFSGCCTTSVGKAAEARCPGLNLVGKIRDTFILTFQLMAFLITHLHHSLLHTILASSCMATKYCSTSTNHKLTIYLNSHVIHITVTNTFWRETA